VTAPINGLGQYAKTVIVPNKNEHRESSIKQPCPGAPGSSISSL